MNTEAAAPRPVRKRVPIAVYTTIGWLAVAVGVGGFLLWGSLAPLDKGVLVTGTLVSEGHRKSTQHPSGGIVDEILVREGDAVVRGQVVARLNSTQAAANLRASREMVQGLQLQIAGVRASRDAKITQAGLLGEQIRSLEELAQQEFVPRNRLLEARRQAAQLQGAIAEDEGNIGRFLHQVAEIRERMVAHEFEIANSALKAPASGVVQGLAVFNSGAVIGPGQKLFDIVPEGAKVVVEGQLPTHLVDKVTPGLEVELIFTALNRATTPHVPARVQLVSPDRFVDERTGSPYFKVHAEVTGEGLRVLNGQTLRPGMPVEFFVKTGERTLMNYLLKPLTDRLHGGMREE